MNYEKLMAKSKFFFKIQYVRYGTVVTMGFLASTVCVLLAHYYRLTDKFAVSLSVSRLICYILVSYINIMTDDR